ncbi:MAG: tetratricopeptide repeat protein, partial [Steroidobacteraceae bacterium]
MMSSWLRLIVLGMGALTLAGCDAIISPQRRIEWARADLDAGKWGNAAVELRKAIQKEPGSARAWLLLARLSLDVGDTRGALSDLDHAVKAGARAREVDPLRVQAWLAMGRPQVLLAAAAQHKLSVAEPALSVAIARADNELRQPDRALAILGPVLTAHPALTDARLAAAEALAREGKFDAAVEQTDTAMANDPHSSTAPLFRARLLQSRGDFSAAESAFSVALQRMSPGTSAPDRATALAGLTESRLAQGEITLASSSAAILEKLVPNASATRLLGARIKLVHGDFVGGISDLEQLVADVPNDLEARLLLGEAQLSRGDLQQAQQNLEPVVRAAPDNVEARELLAKVRLKLNLPDAALEVLTPALDERTIDPQLLDLFGTAAQQSSNPGAALAGLESAVRAEPQNEALRLNLAQADLLANRAKEALDLLQTTQEGGADDLRRDGLLILAVSAVQGPIAAGATVDRLLDTHPHDVQLVDVAATFFASQGDFARARSLFEQALRAAPHDVSSELGLARVDLATNDAAAATALLQNILTADPKNLTVRIALA